MPDRMGSQPMKKVFIGLSAVLLLFLCVIMTGGTKAAAKTVEDYDLVKQSGVTVDVSVNGTKYYNRAYTMLDALNAKRAELNLPAFKMDQTLMERAMERAAELLIYNCSVRTDGTMFIFTDEGGELISLTTLTNANYIVNQWSSEENMEGYVNMRDKDFKSVGVGCVYGGGYYAYAVFLKEDTAKEPATVPNNQSTTFSMKVDKAYLANIIPSINEGYALCRGATTNIYMSVVNIGNTNLKMPLSPTCVNYSSTNSNVLPVSSTGLIQGSSVGKAIIMMKLKSDTSINCTREITVVPSNISVATIDPIPDQAYTGRAVEPAVTVREGTTVLVKGKDYVLTYKDNIEVGTATVYVTGVGEYNDTIIANFNIVKTTPKFSANLSVSSTGLTGDTVTLRASTSDGVSPYTYAFSVKKPNASAFSTIKTGTSYTCTYTPDTAGTYQFKVKVTDGNGATAETTINFAITQKVMSASVSLSATSVQPKTVVTIKPSVSHSTGTVYYTYAYKGSADTSWTTIKSKSTANSCTWTPTKSGSYTIRVTVTDSTTTLYPTASLTVQNSNLSFKTATISANEVLPSTAVTLKAEVQNGIGSYVYAFFYKKSTDSAYTVLQSYSSTNTATFKTATVGTYTLLIRGKDSSGTVVQKNFTLVVSNALKNQSTISASTVVRGGNIVAKGVATGGAGTYQYAYLVKYETSSNYTVLKNYSTSNTYTWTPTVAGTHIFAVKIKDKDGTVAQKNFTVKVTNADLQNVSTISASTVVRGGNIVAKGVATGGAGTYQYAYLVKYETSSNYTVLKNYSTSNTYTWTPTVAGTHIFAVKIKDKDGTVAQKNFTVKVTNADLQNVSTISASTVVRGGNIVAKGVATGGAGTYQYAYLVKYETSGNYTVLKNYSTSNTYTWTPTVAGTHIFAVKIKDKDGTVKQKNFTVKITNADLKNVSTISASTLTRGEYIVLTGKGTGGVGAYQYAIAAKHESSSNYTVLKAYSTTAGYTWTPAKSGTYTITIKVKDDKGTIVQKFFTVKVAAADLTNKSTASATSITLGKSVTLTGNAIGGAGAYQYAMVYRLSTGSTYTVIQNYSKTAKVEWTPKAKGTYYVIVKVKDTNNTIVSKTLKITVT